MKTHWQPPALISLIVGAILLSACSLAGDITPPPGVEVRPLVAPTPTLTVQEVLGTVRASAEVGAEIYAERCAACHGPAGNADGERVPQLPNLPAKFSDPALARAASPQTWFDVITNGRIENFMPPFGQSITITERWHLVAFLYTLSTPAEEVQLGEQVYAASCAECHSVDGKAKPDFTQLSWQASRSPSDSLAALALPDHNFEQLPEAERWAAVNYLRGFALEYAEPGAPPRSRTGVIAGRITNGSAGATVPANLQVQLIGADETGLVLTRTATAQSDGRFEFAAVPYTLRQQFAVTADYQSVAYFSQPARFAVGESQLDASFQIHDATDTVDSLRVSNLQTFVIFQTPEQATLGQLYTFSNTGDRTFIPSARSAVTIRLPEGAENVNVADGVEGQTFLRVNNALADLRPVLPGADTLQMVVSYQLPYAGSLAFSQAQDYAVDEVLVLVGDATVTLRGAAWEASGTQTVQGEPFQGFSRPPLSANETLAFELASANSLSNVLVGGGVLLVVAVGIGWAFWRTRRGASLENQRERLLAQMAELDDALAAGKLSPAQHQRQRDKVKAELKQIW